MEGPSTALAGSLIVADQSVAAEVDIALTGEGALDRQSLRGKGPVGVARRARGLGARVIGVVGINRLDEDELHDASIEKVYAMTDADPNIERCMTEPRQVLTTVAGQMACDVSNGDF